MGVQVKGAVSGEVIELDDEMVGLLADFYLRLAPRECRRTDYMFRTLELSKEISRVVNAERDAITKYIEEKHSGRDGSISEVKAEKPQDIEESYYGEWNTPHD